MAIVRCWHCLIYLGMVATTAASASPRPDPLERVYVNGEVGERLDRQLRAYERQGFAGSVLVAKNRKVILLKGYGLADIKRRVRNTPATRFEMNSITKTFTGAAILQLGAANRLTLEAPLEQLFGPFPPEKRAATLRQLACHTSGLVAKGTELPGESRETFISAMKAVPAESRPGQTYRYTNAGYSLLAAAIEQVTGGPYEAYVRKHLFQAAGLRSAIFVNGAPPSSKFAHGYSKSTEGTIAREADPYVWGRIGAAGIWSTVGDMYRWVLALQDAKVVRGEFGLRMFSPPDAPSAECFGWHVAKKVGQARARIDKGGGSAEFASQILYYPDDDVLIIWANNDLRKRWRSTLNRALPELVFNKQITAAAPDTDQ